MKDGFFAVHHKSMTGVIATLEADDDVSILGEEIDDLAFAFVPPLGPDHHDIRPAESFPRGGGPLRRRTIRDRRMRPA